MLKAFLRHSNKLAALGLAALFFAFPDIAAASGGITESFSPLEQVENTTR
jgi:hypothetical protein